MKMKSKVENEVEKVQEVEEVNEVDEVFVGLANNIMHEMHKAYTKLTDTDEMINRTIH